MALVYRANRIINFAQADLGLAPTILTFLLLDQAGLPYPVAVLAGVAVAITARPPSGLSSGASPGRRGCWSRSPPSASARCWSPWACCCPACGMSTSSPGASPPFDATCEIGGVFDANDLLGLIVTPVVLVAVNVFLHRSAAGTAIRASADSADRASLLGVPVARLQTLVWSVAGALAFTAVFLRSGILDLPTGSALGFSVLLRALVALLLGRLTDLSAVTSAVALGVLELGIAWNHDPSVIEPFLGLIVIVDWCGAGARSGGSTRPTPAAPPTRCARCRPAWRPSRRPPRSLGRRGGRGGGGFWRCPPC
jgi:branched-chain amino acid transport system permease protein